MKFKNVIIVPDANTGGQIAAMLTIEQICKKRNSVLVFPTGNTPIPMYRKLVWYYNKGIIDFSEVTSFNMDEYVGTTVYRDFMYAHLFSFISFKKTYIPDCTNSDWISTSNAYEASIEKSGGIDLLHSGIGENAHIAFNEPSKTLSNRTTLVKLSNSTKEANKGDFGGDVSKVPDFALSIGMDTILSARKIVIQAYGSKKAEAVCQAIEGPITPTVPASFLQKRNDDVTWIIDYSVASMLNR